MRRLATTITAALSALALGVGPAMAAIPSATTINGLPSVGVLFTLGQAYHHCTASVVRSTHGDLVMAAAHCVHGTGVGLGFAPAYRNGRTPYGVWRVTGAYADSAWLKNHDPQHDYVILKVADRTVNGKDRNLQSFTGYNYIGSPPRPQQWVRVVGYVAGTSGKAISCEARAYYHQGYPAFACHGYQDGTSGSPWLTGSKPPYTTRGVIGGLNQGGCVEYVSYSPKFVASDVRALRDLADSGASGDTLTPAGGSGC